MDGGTKNPQSSTVANLCTCATTGRLKKYSHYLSRWDHAWRAYSYRMIVYGILVK